MADSNITIPFWFRNITKQIPYQYDIQIRAGDPLCHLLFLESKQSFNVKVSLQNEEIMAQHKKYRMAQEQHFNPVQVYMVERKSIEQEDE